MGGGVALQLAIRHPATVRRLAVVSAAMAREGWYPEVREAFDAMAVQAAYLEKRMRASPMARQYPHVDWTATFARIGDMQTQDDDWSEAVAAIAVPTMLVFADADAIRLEHMVAFYECLGGRQRGAGLDGARRGASVHRAGDDAL
jgi:pimeloyl-ACP methyl ester carboxylesterase